MKTSIFMKENMIFFRQVREKDLVMPEQGKVTIRFKCDKIKFKSPLKKNWFQHLSRDLSLLLVISNPAHSWTEYNNIFIQIYLLNWRLYFFKF